MVWLKKKTAGSAPGYTWEHDGDVLDVDEELALELLDRPGDEFVEGEPPADGETPEEPEEESEPDDGESDSPETKKPGRRRTRVSE